MTIWNLDDKEPTNDAKRFWAKIESTKHSQFSIGETIEFFTGYNDDIKASARIKAIKGG